MSASDGRAVGVLGVPTSAGAHGRGQDKAPAALRAAGLLTALSEAGVAVVDCGDLPHTPFRADAPDARVHRDVARVAAVARSVADAVEPIVGDGLLPVVLGGDCTITVGVVAAVARRLEPGLFYLDGDLDLSTPETTRSGVLDAMGIAHMLGRGAEPLSRLGPRHPLLSPRNLALFGYSEGQLSDADGQRLVQQGLTACPAETVATNPGRAARGVLDELGQWAEGLVVHFDVDAVDSNDLPLADFPHFNYGLTLQQAIAAFTVAVRHPALAAIVVTEINPDHDPEGDHLARLVPLLAAAVASVGRGAAS